jgi:hypothetical protein
MVRLMHPSSLVSIHFIPFLDTLTSLATNFHVQATESDFARASDAIRCFVATTIEATDCTAKSNVVFIDGVPATSAATAHDDGCDKI